MAETPTKQHPPSPGALPAPLQLQLSAEEQQHPALPALQPQLSVEELGGKCISDEVGALNCLAVAVGHKVGLYAQLKRVGPATAEQLAAAADLSERWVREWLLAQAASRYVACDEHAELFWLTEAQAQVLVEPEHLEDARESALEYLLMVPPLLSRSDELASAFRTSRGLGFDGLGCGYVSRSHRHARALQLQKNLASLTGLHERLQQGVAVAEVGCGSGDVLLHLASTYPASSFVGFDVSKQALAMAEQRKAEKGLSNVQFLNPDDGEASRLPCEPRFHLVLAVEAMHDLQDPQAMLGAIRQSLLPEEGSGSAAGAQEQQADALASYHGGPALVIQDVKSSGSAAANVASPAGALVYGLSLSVCLGSGLSEQGGGAGLGTLGFPESVAREMSLAAGFSRFSSLDWQPSLFNSYFLVRV